MARKKKELPLLEKITITDVAAEGKALAKVNDLVVFVPYVVPGDVVDLQVKRKKNHYAEAVAVKFHEYSPVRAVPFCQHYGICGGCKWQCLPYTEQIKYKQKQVTDNLTRIGKIELPEISPIMGSEKTEFYRNKLEFTFSNKRWLTEEEVKEDDEAFKKTSEELTEVFKKALNNDKLDIKVEKMKNASVASMITVSEETRRMQDMMKMYNMGGMDMSAFGATGETLVLNAHHPLVKYVLENKEGENTVKICEQLYDLASLAHGQLSPERMTNFVNRSNDIMMIMAGQKAE